MKSILKNGSQWPTEPISKEECIGDIEEALQFGNHKGAQSQPELLLKLVTSDIIHGYTIPLPLDKIVRIPGRHMGTVGLMGCSGTLGPGFKPLRC